MSIPQLAMLSDRKPPGKDFQKGWLDSIDQALADDFEEFDLYGLALLVTLRANGQLDFTHPELWQRVTEIKESGGQ